MSITATAGIDPNAVRAVATSLVKPTTEASTAATVGTTAQQGISSNDFLNLLVTEMKNQDPTQPTDPNAYIQQLVGVNSLQQLISINQDLSGGTKTNSPTTTAGISAPTIVGA